MYAREHAEQTILNRLLAEKPTDRVVPNEEYEYVHSQIDLMLKAMASNRLISGFTSEDLEGFLELKLHQMLRQDKYDPSRRPKALFGLAFKNLLNDVNEIKNSALRRGLDADVLDTAVTYLDAVNYGRNEE